MMTGSEAVIGWVDGAGAASVGAYALNGQTIASVVPTTAFSLSGTEGSYVDGRTTIKFVLSHTSSPTHLSLTSASTWLWAVREGCHHPSPLAPHPHPSPLTPHDPSHPCPYRMRKRTLIPTATQPRLAALMPSAIILQEGPSS